MTSPIGPDIVNKLGVVASPAISPDGSVVAFVRGQVEDGKRVSWIECAPFKGGDGRRLTSGRSDSAPSWAPDGSALSFLRPGSDDPGAPRQIWLLPTDGGEATQANRPAALSRRIRLVAGRLGHHRNGRHRSASRRAGRLEDDRRARHLLPRRRARLPRGRLAPALPHRRRNRRRGATHDRQLQPRSSGRLARRALGRVHGGPNVDREKRRPFGSELCVMSTLGVGGGHIERLTPGVMSAGKPCWSPDGTALAVSVTDMSQRHQAYLERIERYSGKRTRLTDDTVNPQTGFFPIAGPPTMVWHERRDHIRRRRSRTFRRLPGHGRRLRTSCGRFAQRPS